MKKLHFGACCLIPLLFGWGFNAVEMTAAQNVINRLPEPFVDVSQQAGIRATHQGEWDQFKPNFKHGYLGIGQAWPLVLWHFGRGWRLGGYPVGGGWPSSPPAGRGRVRRHVCDARAQIDPR